MKFKKTFIYNELIYKNNKYNSKNFSFFRCSMLQLNNCPCLKKRDIFDYYFYTTPHPHKAAKDAPLLYTDHQN